MKLKHCRVCGAQPKLEGVEIAYQMAVRYECQCGRAGAARVTVDAAALAWDQLQEPAQTTINRPAIKCLGTNHPLCSRCLRRTAPEVDGCGWITARIATRGRGGCRNYVEDRREKP